MRRWLKDRLVDFLNHPVSNYERRAENDVDALCAQIRPGDVLLVEGDQRISQVIKLLTHSTWSHSALYIGDELLRRGGELRERALEAWGDDAKHMLVEALMDGVVAEPLAKYASLNLRVCRPHRLRPEHLKTILDDGVAAIGWRYDLRNVVDLAKYFVSVSVLPTRLRREQARMGSEAQTEVICSSLIGQLYQRVGFPVAPTIERVEGPAASAPAAAPRPGMMRRFFLRQGFEPQGIYHRRHPTLLTPRDFDLSPYFEVVKFNAVASGTFDYERIHWADDDFAAGPHRLAEQALRQAPSRNGSDG
ncbi:MAG: lipo-like protein [Myxococcales bacterium]|nr:lipo-like protein [Myxococcales bacterium]